MARPQKEINWEVVIRKMQAGNSAKTIALEHHIDDDTLYKRFKEEFGCGFGDYLGNAIECGKSNIAYTQYMKAMAGNVQMLIHLGKEWLGQGKEEVKVSPYQDTIDISHENMKLRAELAELKAKLYGNESQTGQEFSRSDAQI